MSHDAQPSGGSEFIHRWFAAIEVLSPQEAARILTRTSRGLFVRCMRQLPPPEDSQTLTDAHLHALHEAMCERLHAKAGGRTGAWEVSRPAGQA
ncbi:MAG: hypothetical protein E6K65_00460 [Nitrospirae bacterium]|jgi:hypothetical protein|nr:MAG: hypothetical protein E6K65_00460 [Nitrospirota bacterium]